MQRTIHHLPRNPEMQTFCHFLLQKQIMKLNRTHVISNCRFSCSNSCKKWRNLHHFCSNTSQDEDSGPDAWSLAASKVEQYVPYRTSLKIHNRGEESGIGEEVSRVYSGSICRVELSAPISEEIQNQSEESGRGDEISMACSNSVSNVKKSVPKRSSKGIQDQGEGSSSEGENPLGFSGSESKGYLYGSKKRTGKSKIAWVCANCGTSTGQWWGICQSCQEVGTLRQFSEPEIVGSKARGFEASENAVKSWFQRRPAQSQPQSLKEVNKGINPSEWRIPLSGLFGMEVSMVLGGGVVPGSLVLVGGDPGVGKSTLLLQIAAMLAEGCSSSGPAPVIYVSGEESVEQIGDRADRMKIGTGYLFLYSSTDIEDILQKIQPLSPRALIIDSIQTVYLRGVAGSAGSISQVRECTLALLGFAKQTNLAVFLIGHVTKTGDIAGPRVLEHIVDAVLYMEGERNYSHRLLRSVKNRFGSTDELGVFEMSQLGLQAVSNPGVMFLREHSSDSEILAGCAVAAILDGSRTFLCEVQALCSSVSTVTRHFNGVKDSRADMIISVLMKQAGLKLQGNAIYLNVLSGLKLTETAGDLAIAAAICSSFLEFPIPSDVAFIGEIGLGGELHTVPRMEKRVNELCKLGFKRCVIPKSAQKSLATLSLDGLTLISCRNLKEVINKVFKDEQMQVTNEKTILEAPHLLSGL